MRFLEWLNVDKEGRMVVARNWGGENRQLFNRYRVSFCKMKSSEVWLHNNMNIINIVQMKINTIISQH